MAKAKYTRAADGYFRTRTWDGTYNPDGTKHRINLKSGKSSADLEKQVNALKHQIAERSAVRRSDVLTGDYAKVWLDTYKSTKEKGTYAMYKNIIDNHFSTFAIIQLQNLTRHHIQWLLNESWEHPRTCQQIALTWKQMIKSAIKDKLLPAGAYIEMCDDLEVPRYIAEEKRPLTPEEIAALKIADFSPKEKAFVYLIYGAGLRREEALAQNRFTINLKKQLLYVNNAVGYDGNNPYIKDTKNKRKREVPIPGFLAEYMAWYMTTLSGTYLFNTKGKELMTKSSYDRMWESIIKKINIAAGGSDELQVINGLTAHIFRHNYCTQLCYQVPKLSTKKIAKLLGDSEQMVINVYNHILEEKENAEDAIESAVGMRNF